MKKFLKLPYLLFNTKRLANSVMSQMIGRGLIGENRIHIEASLRWLMKAQQEGGEGFSRKYCLYSGWDKPYIETTGYIIPTLLYAGKYLKRNDILESARTAAYWLLKMQKDSGAFCDIDMGIEQVFDTGQALSGLISAFKEWKEACFVDAANRAGNWLIEVQESDGSWQRNSYNHIKHTYYTKVAAAFLQLHEVTGDSRYRDAAVRNIDWTLRCQLGDGYFKYMHFKEGEHPFLHTIIYVLEGLLDSYDIVNDNTILSAVLKSVNALKEINEKRDLILFSQYDTGWIPINKEKCITGLAQWAGILLNIYRRTGDESLLIQAIKTIYYLKSKHYLRSDENLYGALSGSVPLWGRYQGFCFPNWGIKFFLDALLKYEQYHIPIWKEQEIWVSECFNFSNSAVRDNLSSNDRNYIKFIEMNLGDMGKLKVLDIGCGKGKFINYFKEKYPQWEITGIDPNFSNGDYIYIIKGSGYNIPLSDNYADMIFFIEVMQHIDDLKKVMSEIDRVLKKSGYIVIADRHPFSIVGILKPLIESAGYWMYPWDSPFREIWRDIKQWGKIFSGKWNIIFAKSFSKPGNRIPLSNRYYLIIAKMREL